MHFPDSVTRASDGLSRVQELEFNRAAHRREEINYRLEMQIRANANVTSVINKKIHRNEEESYDFADVDLHFKLSLNESPV